MRRATFELAQATRTAAAADFSRGNPGGVQGNPGSVQGDPGDAEGNPEGVEGDQAGTHGNLCQVIPLQRLVAQTSQFQPPSADKIISKG